MLKDLVYNNNPPIKEDLKENIQDVVSLNNQHKSVVQWTVGLLCLMHICELILTIQYLL